MAPEHKFQQHLFFFTLKLSTVEDGALEAGLARRVLDHAVLALQLIGNNGLEVLAGLRNFVVEQLEGDAAGLLTTDGDVEERLGVKPGD